MNGVSKGKYLYDGDGKRVKKISDLETTIFVYNGGGQLVAEYSTQQTTTPQVSFLTQDHLGSPRIITDNTGKVIARQDFNAFGDETNSTQRTTTLGYKPEEIRQDYTGYQKDDESGLEFAQARYYNNKHGRFTSVDPLVASANVKDPQTFNRYSYALNSPYKFTDPLGLLATSSGSGFCSASNSSCDGDGEELSTQSIDEYRAAQAETESPVTQATSTATGQPAQETAAGPPTPTAEQNADDEYIYANVIISVSAAQYVERQDTYTDTDENGVESERIVTESFWQYNISLSLVTDNGNTVSDVSYSFRGGAFGLPQPKAVDGSMIYNISSTVDQNSQNKETYKIVGSANGIKFDIRFRIETTGINLSVTRYVPDRIPIGIKSAEPVESTRNKRFIRHIQNHSTDFLGRGFQLIDR